MKNEGLYRQDDSEMRLFVDHKSMSGLRGDGCIEHHSTSRLLLLASYSPRPFRLCDSLVVDGARWRKIRESTLAMK